MKVFVGFGYNDNDKWISNLVIPLLEELGCEVVTGEEMQGEDLTKGVITRIKESDACIGFLTKRGTEHQQGYFSTHWWVISELTTALAHSIPIFEIREKGIDPQKGITGNMQRYEFEDKAFLLLEIARFIAKVKKQVAYKTFMLMPTEFSSAIRPHIKYAKCTYKFLYRGKEYMDEEAKLVPLHGSYGLIIKKIPDEEAFINISIDCPAGSWSSGYVSVGMLNINLIPQ